MMGRLIEILAPENAIGLTNQRMATYVRIILGTLAVLTSLIIVLNSDLGSRIGGGLLLVYALSGLVLSKFGHIRISRITIPLVCWVVFSALV